MIIENPHHESKAPPASREDSDLQNKKHNHWHIYEFGIPQIPDPDYHHNPCQYHIPELPRPGGRSVQHFHRIF